jgi:hypothetical protein
MLSSSILPLSLHIFAATDYPREDGLRRSIFTAVEFGPRRVLIIDARSSRERMILSGRMPITTMLIVSLSGKVSSFLNN